MTRTRTVLITGSLGYIGSRLTGYLMERGLECVGYDTGFFQDCTLYPSHDPSTRLADARDLRPDDLDGIDAVVHLAGLSNDPLKTLAPERLYDPTRVYARHIAGLCKALGVRFIFASSCSVYGIGREDLVTEASEPNPQTPYSVNKLQVEQDLHALSDGDFHPIALRCATVYGLSSRMRFDLVVNMFVGMALATGRMILNSNGKAWRPHAHLDDVCEAIWRCLDAPPPAEGLLVLNVGRTDQNIQIADVAALVKTAVPGSQVQFLNQLNPQEDRRLELVRDRKIQDGVDARTYRVGFNRIEAILPGFRCRWSLEDGIEAMVRDLKVFGVTAAQIADPRFYRLQRLESLVEAGALSPDLRWTDSASQDAGRPMSTIRSS